LTTEGCQSRRNYAGRTLTRAEPADMMSRNKASL
jgi:hypothetical protein